MKCFSDEVFQKYIDGELSVYEMAKISKHLDECEYCMEQFLKQSDMIDFNNNLLKKEQSELNINLDKSFERLQNKLNKVNIKGDYKIMKNKKKIIALVASIGIFAVGVPVFGTEIVNFFQQNVLNDKLVNEGFVKEDGTVVDALEDGQFIKLDKKITNNGITVHITDLFVAKTRISVNYRIEDENGILLPYEFNTEGLDIRDNGIENGKQIYEPTYYIDKENGIFSVLAYIQTDNENNLPFNLIKDGKVVENTGIRETHKDDTTEFVKSFVSSEPIPYPVVIDININKIGETEGQWKTQIEVTEDMLNKQN